MDFLASLFVGKPQNILMVAIFFLLGYIILKFITKSAFLHPHPLLILFVVWGAYALWELLIQIKTPDANIRVDLMLIWPILGILSAWKLFQVFR